MKTTDKDFQWVDAETRLWHQPRAIAVTTVGVKFDLFVTMAMTMAMPPLST